MSLFPRDLLDLFIRRGIKPRGPVAWDTETSGLYADDGARVSTVSVAWVDWSGQWEEFVPLQSHLDLHGYTATYRYERPVKDMDEMPIISIAWPFDQGREGKIDGQDTLWPDAHNLDQREWKALLDWLGLQRLVAHNAKFDLEKMRVGVRRWPGVGAGLEDSLVWDTQNVNSLLWPLERTSLKPTCARLFGDEYADEGRLVKDYLRKAKLPSGRWDLMPWDVIGTYADMDARLTMMLYHRQVEAIANGGASWLGSLTAVDEAVNRRLQTTLTLYRMERRGLPYDEASSREAAQECMVRADRVARGLPFRPTLPEAKAYFFGEGTTSKGVECLNHIPYQMTDKGSPQMTAEVVQRMVADGLPHADRWAEYQKATTAASMWYQGYADAMGVDGRLRTCFRQNGTVSSRFSVERVNLQAIPQDYRLSDHSVLAGIPTPRDLIASAVTKGMPGWRIYELDLAQAELRVGAMWAECTSMLSMISSGEDLHTYTTQALFDKGPGDAEFGRWRQIGKRANFSLLFGSGAKTFKAMVSKETGTILTEAEAERIVRDWNGLYPEFRRAIDRHSDKVTSRQAKYGKGWIDLLTGERRWFERYEEGHKAFNQRVQANLAQFGIDWMLETDAYLDHNVELAARAREDGVGEVGLVLTIHDSQVLLLPDDDDGRMWADTCAGFGRELWANRFTAVPGEVDYHAWMA